jgi:hypothetical protein
MPLRGDVKTFSLTAIVRLINAEAKTGVLTVAGEGRKSLVYFKDGKIVFTSGYRAKELRLGALLKANNLITEEKLQEMLKIAKVVEKRLGTLLLERGYISQENLVRILSYQVKEAITEILTWQDADFTYAEGLDGFVEDIRFEVDPLRLVTEAQQWGKYRRIIPNDDIVFQIKPGALRTKSIYSGAALRVLLLIDGKRTVAQIIGETGYSRMAVYRALASLLSAEAVGRSSELAQSPEPTPLHIANILFFYWKLLQVITADLAGELGTRKATDALEASVRHLSVRDDLLLAFQPHQDTAELFRRIQARVQGEGRSGKDLLKGLNQALVALLGEEYRLLGSKATTGTVSRLKESLDELPEHQRPLAGAMKQFLSHYEDEASLSRTRKAAPEPGGVEGKASPAGSDSIPNLESVGGAGIVSFYSDMIRVVMGDLEKVLGAKARDLFQETLQGSTQHGTFLSQFSPQNNGNANAMHIREHLKTRELKMSKQELAGAFQQLLLALLREEGKLLGSKATQQTISRLVEAMARTEMRHKPLIDCLSSALVGKTTSEMRPVGR